MATNRAPAAPSTLGQAGTKLWRTIVRDFHLQDHELVQLEEAALVRDRIAQLRDLVDSEGPMITNSQGRRLHPAIPEIRAQQLTLARLLVTLGVPSLEEDNLPASRGVRGVYDIGGGR